MTETEFRLAITGPTESARLSIDPALVTAILGDLRAELAEDASGALPLLSQAMALTWEKREGNRLTSRGYDQCGGVKNAVRVSAEGVYAALPPVQQSLARQLLRTMTVSTREGQFSRRPVTRAVLYAAHSGADPRQLDAVLEAFAAERLIVLDGNSAQLSHDVLFTAWPRLREWLEDDQVSWILHGQLADDAAAWRDHGDDASFLYRGTQLAQLRQASQRWAADPERSPTLAESERHFLLASERAVTRSIRCGGSDAEVRLWDAADPTELHEIGDPFRASNGAEVPALAFSSNGLLATGGDDGTVRLWNVSDPTRPEQVGQPLMGALGNVWSLAFSPTGNTLAAGDGVGHIWLWHIPRTTLIGARGSVRALAFAPSGHLLAVGSNDGSVRLWDVSDPARPEEIGPMLPGGSAASFAFAPDHQTLAISDYAKGTVQLWNIADPVHPQPMGPPIPGPPGVAAISYSPDGRTLAIVNANNGEIALWNVTDPTQPRQWLRPLQGGASGIFSLSFSRNSQIMVTGGSDGNIRLWDVADPSKSHLVGAPTPVSAAGILSIAVSGDGKVVASGQGDGTVQLYSISDGLSLRKIGKPLTESNTAITSLAFNSNGKELVTGIEGNGQAGVWDLSNLAHPLPVDQPLPGSPSSVLAVAFSPDGRILATGNVDHTVRLWNFNTAYAIKYICTNTAGDLGSRQWNNYFPDVPFKAPCRG